MTDPVDHYLTRRTPTAQRPLLGLTILLVEDSRFASEAIRMMGLRSGARLRRADSLRSARRHLAAYRPAVVICDLGLPDGCGTELIAELRGQSEPMDAILAMSGDPDGEQRALGAGAHGFLGKPVGNLGVFQEAVLALLPDVAKPRGPRALSRETLSPDPLAFRDDMAHVAALMQGEDAPQMADYIAQFLSGVAASASDGKLVAAVDALRLARAAGKPVEPDFSRLRALVQHRLDTKAVI